MANQYGISGGDCIEWRSGRNWHATAWRRKRNRKEETASAESAFHGSGYVRATKLCYAYRSLLTRRAILKERRGKYYLPLCISCEEEKRREEKERKTSCLEEEKREKKAPSAEKKRRKSPLIPVNLSLPEACFISVWDRLTWEKRIRRMKKEKIGESEERKLQWNRLLKISGINGVSAA